MSERFSGSSKLPEPARTSADVIAFLLWEILRGRSFAPIDATRAASLKMSITVAHHVSENVEVIFVLFYLYLFKCVLDVANLGFLSASSIVTADFSEHFSCDEFFDNAGDGGVQAGERERGRMYFQLAANMQNKTGTVVQHLFGNGPRTFDQVLRFVSKGICRIFKRSNQGLFVGLFFALCF
jgi:hypothetical protein